MQKNSGLVSKEKVKSSFTCLKTGYFHFSKKFQILFLEINVSFPQKKQN